MSEFSPIATTSAQSIMERLRVRAELSKILGPTPRNDGGPWITPDVQKIIENDIAYTIDAAVNRTFPADLLKTYREIAIQSGAVDGDDIFIAVANSHMSLVQEIQNLKERLELTNKTVL